MPPSDFERVQHALRDAGLPADDFGRFVNETKLARHPELRERWGPAPVFDHENAVPVLVAVLPTLTELDAMEASVRHLTTRYAKPQAAIPLMDLFEALPTSDTFTVKWTIGNALSTVTTKDHRDRLLALCLDGAHGPDRQMIVTRVGYFKGDDGVTAALVELIRDEDVALHAMGALRVQVGAEAARAHIVPLLEDDSDVIRTQANRQLRKIDRALTRSSG